MTRSVPDVFSARCVSRAVDTAHRAERDEFDALRGGAAALDPGAKKVFAERMLRRYPDAKVTFLVDLGADPVAAELAAEADASRAPAASPGTVAPPAATPSQP